MVHKFFLIYYKLKQSVYIYVLTMVILSILVKPSLIYAKTSWIGGALKGFGAYEPNPAEKGTAQITLIFTNLFAVLTLVGGLIFMVQFLLAGIGWISSSGKPEKVQKAQDKMIHAAIGFIAVVATYGLTYIIGKVLGIDILDPASYIEKLWS